jgi:hypothetical protein
MDVYLAADAVRTLQAVHLLSPGGKNRGFLLGHRRGERIYVENAILSPSPAWPSLQTYYRLEAGLQGKIIGFFLKGSDPASRKNLLQPFGVGKVLIEIRGRGGRPPAFRGSMIDYEDRFLFRAISVIVETPAGTKEKRS